MSKPANEVPSKRKGLVVQSIGDEVIVYDAETHQAHSLNRSAAAVFRHIDGKANVSEIARRVGRELPGGAHERVVRAGLDRIEAAGLLATAPAGGSRRAVIRGMAIALVPVVTSILVPKPAAASSCVGFGSPCGLSTPCCIGCCNPTAGCTSVCP